jgi:hypothetical protein
MKPLLTTRDRSFLPTPSRRIRPPGRRARRLVVASCALAVAAGTIAVLGPNNVTASSHREAPLTAGDPQIDDTDLYAFVSPDKPDTVTLVGNWYPFEEPNGGPNFYPFATDARYNINVDNDGDARADVTYSWTFKNNYRDDSGQFLYNTGPVKSLDDPNLNFFQTYDTAVTVGGVTRSLTSGGIVAPSYTGAASMPEYGSLRQQAVKPLPDGGQQFVGQSDDPFFLDLRVFDLLYGTNLKESGHDTLAGYNVNTIAIQVPKSVLAARGDATANPVIGVWSATERQGARVTSASSGEYVQVSRLGNPLVNEVVVPLKYKDAFNGLTPDKDHTVAPVVDKVLNPILPGLIQSVYGIQAPATPRNDLFEIFLTGICKECKAPDGTVALPIDLNSQLLNRDGKKGAEFVPSEQLRLNMSIAPAATPDRLGVLAKDLAGFPNGRRLTDDVVDIAVQTVEGAAQSGELVQALAAGDGVDKNDVAFGQSFPYVALPHGAAVNEGKSLTNSTTGSAAGGAAQPSPAGAETEDDDSSSAALFLGLGVVVILVAGGAALLLRRKQA